MSTNVLVLDCYNLIHRARGGFQKGDWSVVFNFFRSLRVIIDEWKPAKIEIVLEGFPKRNKELLPEYKANRKQHNEDFTRQKDKIISLLSLLPVTLLRHSEFEADDVVFNIINEITSNGKSVVLLSTDSDFTQIAQRINNPKLFTLWNWREKKEVPVPEYDYIIWKALLGDATDNVPKCPRINENTAKTLANDSHLLDASMNDEAFKKTFERNFEVIQLKAFTEQENAGITRFVGAPCWPELRIAFDSLEFKSITNDKSWDKFMSTFKCIENN